ncbi:MAG TPA: cytochrome c [Bryobacteraceae bacterium]|nr:cytochrome c [Bryobacteraceae bacterium]
MKLRIAAAAILAAGAAAGYWDRSVWDGVYTEEQARRGETLYQQQCARCHGVSLTGGEEAPPLSGGGFLANWNGTTAGDLSERIRTTMPPDAPGRLGRQQNTDVLSHLFRVNGFPPGKAELPRETEILKQIRIEAEKPGGR